MARYFLTEVSIQGFRGINNEDHPLVLKFKPDSVSSVFGLNGIGKSSIFEALHYAIHGTIPKLDSLQSQEHPRDYYCNLFHSKRKAHILLEFQPDDETKIISISIYREGDGTRIVNSPSGYPNPKRFLAMFAESFTLLDYNTFTRFIEDSPLERGRTFSALLGLVKYSDCRQSLQVVSDTRILNTDLDLKTLGTTINSAQMAEEHALRTLTTNYENITGKSLVDGDNLEELDIHVTNILKNTELLKPHIGNSSVAEIDFGKLKSEIQSAEGGKEREELSKTIGAINALETLPVHNHSDMNTEKQKIRALIDERDKFLESTRGDLFKHFYEAAQVVIEKGHWTEDSKCPLCESFLKLSITEYIKKQLEQYSEVSTKLVQIKDLWQSSQWKVCLKALENSAPLSIAPENKQLAMLNSKFELGELSNDDLVSTSTWTKTLLGKVVETLEDLQKRQQELESELPESLVRITEQVEQAQQFSDSLAFLKTTREEKRRQQARRDIRERWKKFISHASDIFSQAETALSKARVEELEAQYTSMFQHIMQSKSVVPSLHRANKKEDLHVRLSDFHGRHSLSAIALLSESYRNALALSVFLAAAMNHSDKMRFVVLDDVSSSFDTGHQFLLFELIRTKLQQPRNANGLQFIILSHDVVLQKYFDRLSSNTEWEHYTLQGTPPRGLVHSQREDVDRLKNRIMSFLNSGQTDSAEPLIRHYLEFKLQQIIRKVNIPVHIDFALRDTNRTVNNCVNAIQSAISLHEKAGTLVLTEQQIQNFDALHVPAIVSNWGAHWETGAVSSLSPQVLNGVMGYIDDLVECFRYDDTSNGASVRKWYRTLDRDKAFKAATG